jgi:hypothetical protein
MFSFDIVKNGTMSLTVACVTVVIVTIIDRLFKNNARSMLLDERERKIKELKENHLEVERAYRRECGEGYQKSSRIYALEDKIATIENEKAVLVNRLNGIEMVGDERHNENH